MTLYKLDMDLLKDARSGNRQAMEELLLISQPDIRRYAMKHCTISDIDDAVQEVLLTIARKLETLKVLAAFSSWIFKTVQRECRRLGRVALKYDPFEEGELEKWLNKHTNEQLFHELLDVIEKMPAEQRDVIIMKEIQQLANQEIAQELGITVAAVKSRVHRARNSSRRLLLD